MKKGKERKILQKSRAHICIIIVKKLIKSRLLLLIWGNPDLYELCVSHGKKT